MTHPEKEIQNVIDQLGILEPKAADAPHPAGQALVKLARQIEHQQRHTVRDQFWRYVMAGNRRFSYAAFLFVLMFGVAFSFSAVRAAASDFLGLFRVQKFSAISISPEQIALLQQVAEEGLTPGELEIIEEPGALRQADSLVKAGRETGISYVRSLNGLGEPDEIWVADGGNGRLTVDLAGARAIVEAAGADPLLLPDSLDGAQVDVIVYAGVQQQWLDGTMFMQTPSPVVEYPDDVDTTVLGEALLQVLGLNDDEAARLARSIDWTSTLLLPIPQDFASFNEVTVDGVSGLALNSLAGDGSALFWQKSGTVYLLIGADQNTEDLISLAGTLD